MKRLLLSLFVFLLFTSFVYGCISFYYMELNAKLWPWDGRYFQVFGFIIGGVLSVFYYHNNKPS